MIRLNTCTPEVYYSQSRDFQFIGRLFDMVLNSVKTNVDLVYNIPSNDNLNNKLVDLLTMSLGFKSKHDYNVRQLMALCKVFPEVLRNKGNIKAIELAGNALLTAEGLPNQFTCYMENNILNMFIPRELSDINLLRDLLNYIVPAGIICKIIRAISKKNDQSKTILTTEQNITITKTLDDSTSTSSIIRPDDETVDASNLTSDGIFINSTIGGIKYDN